MSFGGTVHNVLKIQARKILLERGFSDDDIQYEYRVKIGKKTYIVDVVGFKNGVIHTGIECGGVTNKEKLIHLNALFEVVEHIPYVDSAITKKMNEYEKTIKIKEKELEELRKRLEPPKISKPTILPIKKTIKMEVDEENDDSPLSWSHEKFMNWASNKFDNMINRKIKRKKLINTILPDDLHNEFSKWLDDSFAPDNQDFESFLKYVKSDLNRRKRIATA
jgi:hypothetical protein